jgi:hypothetical protein
MENSAEDKKILTNFKTGFGIGCGVALAILILIIAISILPMIPWIIVAGITFVYLFKEYLFVIFVFTILVTCIILATNALANTNIKISKPSTDPIIIGDFLKKIYKKVIFYSKLFIQWLFKNKYYIISSFIAAFIAHTVYKEIKFRININNTNGSLIINNDGSEVWELRGKKHRIDGYALKDKEGNKFWYINDQLHRIGEPAIERTNGTKEWFLNNKRHREDGPAFEQPNGYKAYYIEGKLHNFNAPAITWPNGKKEYWINGLKIKEE